MVEDIASFHPLGRADTWGMEVIVFLCVVGTQKGLGWDTKAKLGKMAKGLMREQRRRQRWILWVLETDFSCDWSELTPPP